MLVLIIGWYITKNGGSSTAPLYSQNPLNSTTLLDKDGPLFAINFQRHKLQSRLWIIENVSFFLLPFIPYPAS